MNLEYKCIDKREKLLSQKRLLEIQIANYTKSMRSSTLTSAQSTLPSKQTTTIGNNTLPQSPRKNNTVNSVSSPMRSNELQSPRLNGKRTRNILAAVDDTSLVHTCSADV
jgi:hypothetical protein